MKRIFKRKSKDENKKAIKFIAIWADDNGNGTFGVLASLCKTKEAAIVEVLKDIEINNYIDPIKLDQCSYLPPYFLGSASEIFCG